MTQAKGKPKATVTERKAIVKKADDWRGAFLSALASTGVVRSALMQTGVTRDAYKQMMHRSPNFRAMVEDAMADAIDLIEYRGVQRAIGGSDRMIEFFLRAHRPDLYDKGQKVDLTLMVREMAEREGIDPDEAEAEAARLLKGGA